MPFRLPPDNCTQTPTKLSRSLIKVFEKCIVNSVVKQSLKGINNRPRGRRNRRTKLAPRDRQLQLLSGPGRFFYLWGTLQGVLTSLLPNNPPPPFLNLFFIKKKKNTIYTHITCRRQCTRGATTHPPLTPIPRIQVFYLSLEFTTRRSSYLRTSYRKHTHAHTHARDTCCVIRFSSPTSSRKLGVIVSTYCAE